MASDSHVTPENLSLFELVKEANEGKLALPQFQRSFVWSPEDVRELLVSVFNMYFIGSLLLMDVDRRQPPFGIRPVEGCAINEDSLSGLTNRIILDGQQRITSLYYAFFAPDIPLKGYRKNSTVFFIDLKKLFAGDIESSIYYSPRNRCQSGELNRGEWQFENLRLPLTELFSWSSWSGAYSIWLARRSVDDMDRWATHDKPEWDAKVQSVFNFRVPVITLGRIDEDDSGKLEEICTVFEKLNNTGVRLNVFDLLSARLYPKHVFIHELWESALESSSMFSQFSNVEQSTFGLLLLRFIALHRRHDLKSKALINLSHRDFNSDWELAVKYFDEAYARLIALHEDGYGVFTEKWLPSTSMIPVLAALLQKRDSLEGRLQGDALRAIQWWYWGSVFTIRYTGPVETVSQRDYTEMSRFFEHQDTYPEALRSAYNEVIRNQSGFSLLEVERTTNTMYKGVMCLLARNGARDFRKDEHIEFAQLEDHHIFPQGYLKTEISSPIIGLSGTTMYNNIINRTLISAATNRSIGKKPPSVYLADDNIIVQEGRRELLGNHFINSAGSEALLKDNYEGFLRARHAEILHQIRRLFDGMPPPPSLD